MKQQATHLHRSVYTVVPTPPQSPNNKSRSKIEITKHRRCLLSTLLHILLPSKRIQIPPTSCVSVSKSYREYYDNELRRLGTYKLMTTFFVICQIKIVLKFCYTISYLKTKYCQKVEKREPFCDHSQYCKFSLFYVRLYSDQLMRKERQ